MSERARVLCVDDEQNVLEGLALHLRRRWHVYLATSGSEGLAIIEREGPFAVVLSDMRMPEMDGATFLSHVRSVAPDSVRMLLTGQTDFSSAVAAVNEGQVFRFLTKPCPPDQLRTAFEAAAEQHRLVTAERVLLEQTLHGSIKALTDALALTHPLAFGRATRVKKYAGELARTLGIPHRWQVEVAAMLSQLGWITLPAETVEKHYYGKALTSEEQAMVNRLPAVSGQLLGQIPRLEPILEILAQQDAPWKKTESLAGQSPPVGARLLKVSLDFDVLQTGGYSTELALAAMRGHAERYDPEILEAFATLRGVCETERLVKALPLKAMQVGMILAEDVRMSNGALLVAKGFEVTSSFLERVRNIGNRIGDKPFTVIVPAPSPTEESP